MNLITLDKISKSYSEKILLDNVTLNINEFKNRIFIPKYRI